MTGPLIEVAKLSKRYGAGPLAVDDLTFSVERGSVYGLLGPNGSGKSTTVGVLATLLAPSGGRAAVAGFDVVGEPDAVRRSIGVTLQLAGVDLGATGRELLTLHGRLLGLRKASAAERANELLEEFGLADAGDRRVRTYSGGMRRRIDIALALVGEPKVVFLDEPTTGLDIFSRRALWAEVRRLRDAGTAVLLTTQYLEEADALSDRVGILVRGALRAEGSPGELKRRVGGNVLTIAVNKEQQTAAAAVLSAEKEGETLVRLTVADGGAAIPSTLATLAATGIAAHSVTLKEPTLDDVFLAVAGERLVLDERETFA